MNKYLSTLAPTNFFFLYVLANNVDYTTLQDILKGVADSSPEIVETVKREKTIIRQKTIRMTQRMSSKLKGPKRNETKINILEVAFFPSYPFSGIKCYINSH